MTGWSLGATHTSAACTAAVGDTEAGEEDGFEEGIEDGDEDGDEEGGDGES